VTHELVIGVLFALSAVALGTATVLLTTLRGDDER
jgi:hypothetical protein